MKKMKECERRRWESVGHRMMRSSDLWLLCRVERSCPDAEKPFIASLGNGELEGMAAFVLECMLEVDGVAKDGAKNGLLQVPCGYGDRQQEYFRLQVPKKGRYRNSELYDAQFMNDFDEGHDTLQGVFVTLSRALWYLFEEMRLRDVPAASALLKAFQGDYPAYAPLLSDLGRYVWGAGKQPVEVPEPSSIGLKLSLSAEQVGELSGCLGRFFTPSDSLLLERLLQGEAAQRALVFEGRQNQLVELFRRLHYCGFMHGSRSSLRDWICCNFSCRRDGAIIGLGRDTVWGILSKAKGEPPSKSRICMLPWLPYRTQSALKRLM